MSELVPAARRQLVPTNLGMTKLERRTARDVALVDSRTIVRFAQVRGEAMVQVEKMREIDRLAREAMSGQVMLTAWANHLAGENPITAEELRFFTDMARLGKGELMRDTLDSFRRI